MIGKIFTKKRILSLVFAIVMFQAFIPGNLKVFAEENQNSTTMEESMEGVQKETDSKLGGLYDYINNIKTDEELLTELNPKEYIENYIKTGEGNLELKDIASAIVSFLFQEVKSVLTLIISVVAIALLCSFLKGLEDAFDNNVCNVAFYACYAILIVLLTKSFMVSISVGVDVINSISEFMNVLLPILIGMIALAGGFVQAATMDPIVLGAVVLIPKFYANILIPIILFGFALNFANNLSSEHKIDNLCKFINRSVLWIQGGVLTVFIGLLTIRGITAETMDAVALKTTKFAVDNFVPIVGKAFSDAITSAAGYSLIIKNAVTGVGLTVILLIVLYPIVKLIAMTFIYKLSSAVVEPISDGRITKAIGMVGDSLVLLMSCVVSVSFMFFILLGIMASTGRFVVGG